MGLPISFVLLYLLFFLFLLWLWPGSLDDLANLIGPTGGVVAITVPVFRACNKSRRLENAKKILDECSCFLTHLESRVNTQQGISMVRYDIFCTEMKKNLEVYALSLCLASLVLLTTTSVPGKII